jgi:hypothetical protein
MPFAVFQEAGPAGHLRPFMTPYIDAKHLTGTKHLHRGRLPVKHFDTANSLSRASLAYKLGGLDAAKGQRRSWRQTGGQDPHDYFAGELAHIATPR